MTASGIPVELHPHSPIWAEAASLEIHRVAPAFGTNLVTIHHIGSTAIPGILAKPILDLLPVVQDLARLDENRPAVEALGYEWLGEFGIPGRRFCRLTDPATGRRTVHMHCFQDAHIERHLAFRDYLRSHPNAARQYEALKIQCRNRHPADMNAYSECKHEWIQRIEADAVAFYRSRRSRDNVDLGRS